MSKEQNYVGLKNNSNSSKSVFETIEGTPFRLIGSDENGFAIAYGRYRVTDIKPTTDEALQELVNQQWNILARMAGIIADLTLDKHLQENH